MVLRLDISADMENYSLHEIFSLKHMATMEALLPGVLLYLHGIKIRVQVLRAGVGGLPRFGGEHAFVGLATRHKDVPHL